MSNRWFNTSLPVLRGYNILRELVVRDIKVRYRRSFLGLFWTLLSPLLTMMVMTLVFSALFKMTIPHFPVYFLAGSILFSFNTEATTSAMMSIFTNGSLIKKVSIPKYLFPMARVLSALINLGFACLALLIVMIIIGVPFRATLFIVPVPIVYLVLFTTGISLALAALTVFFRDINHLYSVLVMLWMYMTPLFYPVSIIPDGFSWIYKLNPMYYYIEYFRSLVLEGVIPGVTHNVICLLSGVLSLLVGMLIFRRLQDRFILHM